MDLFKILMGFSWRSLQFFLVNFARFFLAKNWWKMVVFLSCLCYCVYGGEGALLYTQLSTQKLSAKWQKFKDKLSIKAHRIETTITKNGILILKDLLFQAGEAMEIIIREIHLNFRSEI